MFQLLKSIAPGYEGYMTQVGRNQARRVLLSQDARTIRELRAMSNAELSDMGISRGGIVDAVRNGRPEPELEAPRRLRKEQLTAPAKDYAEDVTSELTQGPHNAAA